MKIIFTGGSGRFGKIFKSRTKLKNIKYPSRKELNIRNKNSIIRYLSKHRPKIIIHAAALSRPMEIHEKNITKSIETNIIGTCNLVNACNKFKVKLIYFSTNYVYPGQKGNYKETDPLLPYNNYAWSKLGGECAVQMLKNSLILRICMTEKPFIHKLAFKDLKANFIFHESIVSILPELIKKNGIINVGGKSTSVFNFAKKHNSKVEGAYAKKMLKYKIPLDHSMNITKIKKIVKNKKIFN